jgi:hypothetical protein
LTVYFTTYGDLALAKAYSMSIELANKAFSHSLTVEDTTTDLPLNTNPFAYNTTTSSRYTLTVFIGIMIDIGAVRKSTAGYGQFQVL